MFIQWIMVMIIRWQSDLVNSEESIRPDKPYHTNKVILQKGEEIKNLQNYALSQ